MNLARRCQFVSLTDELLCSSAIVDHVLGCAEAQCPRSAPVLPSPWKNPKIVPKSLFLPLNAVFPA